VPAHPEIVPGNLAQQPRGGVFVVLAVPGLLLRLPGRDCLLIDVLGDARANFDVQPQLVGSRLADGRQRLRFLQPARSAQPHLDQPRADQRPLQSPQHFVRLDPIGDDLLADVPGRQNVGDIGRASPPHAVRIHLPGQCGAHPLDAGIAQTAAVPGDDDAIFGGKMAVKPRQHAGLRVLLGKPVLDVVVRLELPQGDRHQRSQKEQTRKDPQGQPVAPGITLGKKVGHPEVSSCGRGRLVDHRRQSREKACLRPVFRMPMPGGGNAVKGFSGRTRPVVALNS
jgi:hypothetical protein